MNVGDILKADVFAVGDRIDVVGTSKEMCIRDSTYSNFAKNRLDMAKRSAYPFFVADYTGSVTYPGTYQMWQYSSTGRVPGISGNVDMDHSYVDVYKRQGRLFSSFFSSGCVTPHARG